MSPLLGTARSLGPEKFATMMQDACMSLMRCVVLETIVRVSRSAGKASESETFKNDGNDGREVDSQTFSFGVYLCVFCIFESRSGRRLNVDLLACLCRIVRSESLVRARLAG